MHINNLPDMIETKDGTTIVRRVKWSDVKDGEVVYIFATCTAMKREYAAGPFTVVNAEDRKLRRTFPNSARWFYHYPEELYR